MRADGCSASPAGSSPRTLSSIHCCAGVSASQPTRCAIVQVPRSSPCTSTSPARTGRAPQDRTCAKERWKPRCQSIPQAGHQAGSTPVTIHDSWTGKANESLFKPFYTAAREARTQLIQAGGEPYKNYKTRLSIALRRLWPKRPLAALRSGGRTGAWSRRPPSWGGMRVHRPQERAGSPCQPAPARMRQPGRLSGMGAWAAVADDGVAERVARPARCP
ncbi:hypothetical protein [Streptomyces mirabilis]|uniref:hypothetical protein n=1 Tax=Streptomyces mirabilis TaxID=68239 RepID=UPI00367A2056